jgi:Protein of unknown function (DUF3341)
VTGHHPAHEASPWGLLAEFNDPDALIAAVKRARAAGYTKLDAYTPYPIGEVADALGNPKSEMGTVMFIGGICGAAFGFLMECWVSMVDYPLNIGGRPTFSWPSFIPITFELMVLTASLSGLFGLLALCGLPQLYHPLFNVPRFALASRDKFFLCIEAQDPKFDRTVTREFLAELHPAEPVAEVPQ